MDQATYEQRRQERIDRLRARAARLDRESDAAYQSAHRDAACIPLGQPILVGHHSEGRDRRFRARIDSKFRKSFQLQEESEACARRAIAAESNSAIQSDNPDALQLLREKLAGVEEQRSRARKINQCLRKNDVAGCLALGLNEKTIAELQKPAFPGDIGFPRYKFANWSGQIRQIKERIAALEAKPKVDRETVHGDVKVVENTCENRVQVFFPGKPEQVVREELKRYGFRWAPSQGAWQRILTNIAVREAQRIANESSVERKG